MKYIFMEEYKTDLPKEEMEIPVQEDGMVKTAQELGGKVTGMESEDVIVEQVGGREEVVLPDGTRVDAETGEIILQGPSDD